MSETQTSKHEFPQDWSNITDKEAIERINYLLKHYKEYDMRKFGDDGVIINEISFYPVNVNLRHGVTFKYIDVNTQKIYSNIDDIYPLIQQLIRVCKVEIKKREQQAKIKAEKQKKIERIVNIVGISAIIILVVAGAYEIVKEAKTNKQEQAKQIKIENEVKRYEKTLPYYKEYELTKQQLQNYRDSLNRVYQ